MTLTLILHIIYFSVLIFAFFVIFKRISNIQNEIVRNRAEFAITLKKLISIENLNKNFQDASFVYDQIIKKVYFSFDSKNINNTELRFALVRSIEDTAILFKRIYAKGLENLDVTYITDSILNIMTETRNTVNVNKLYLRNKKEFADSTERELENYIYAVSVSFHKFKNGFYNGTSLDEYVNFTSTIILNSITIVIDNYKKNR